MMSLGFASTCICRWFLQCWWRAPACIIVIYSLVVSVGSLLARDLVPGAGLHPRANTTQTCFFCFPSMRKPQHWQGGGLIVVLQLKELHMHTRTWFQLICQSLHMCATLSTTRHTIRMHVANYAYVRTCKTQHGAKCFPCTHVPRHSTACCHRHMRKATSDIMFAYVTARQQWRQAQLSNAFFTRKTNQNKTWTIILSRTFVVRVQQDTFRVVDVDPSTQWRWAQLVWQMQSITIQNTMHTCRVHSICTCTVWYVLYTFCEKTPGSQR